MTILFDDNDLHLNFAPLTLTRPVSELRFGILTISESWLTELKPTSFGYKTENYLQEKFQQAFATDIVIIAGNIKPTKQIIDLVKNLKVGERLEINERWVATKGIESVKTISKSADDFLYIENCWDLFQKNDLAIQSDFNLLTNGKTSALLSKTNQILGQHPIFLESGAKVECAILNATDGPIYVGKNAEIMEGSMIRGPFALGESAVVKMGTKIYGATTIGPFCKVGGEISNCLFQSYSNKGHDGFLGNSLIGEWCNFGADSNTSNLMNTYSQVKIYSYKTNQLEQRDIVFCGLIMGDHSKTGINSMFNTATVVGVSSNIFGAGFPNKYVPSFTWGGAENSTSFKFDKAIEVATNMMKRRNLELTSKDKKILQHLFELAQ